MHKTLEGSFFWRGGGRRKPVLEEEGGGGDPEPKSSWINTGPNQFFVCSISIFFPTIKSGSRGEYPPPFRVCEIQGFVYQNGPKIFSLPKFYFSPEEFLDGPRGEGGGGGRPYRFPIQAQAGPSPRKIMLSPAQCLLGGGGGNPGPSGSGAVPTTFRSASPSNRLHAPPQLPPTAFDRTSTPALGPLCPSANARGMGMCGRCWCSDTARGLLALRRVGAAVPLVSLALALATTCGQTFWCATGVVCHEYAHAIVGGSMVGSDRLNVPAIDNSSH